MPPDLGPAFPLTWDGRPPHMAASDLPLWILARPQLQRGVTAWYYDAAVGEGNPPANITIDDLASAYWRLTRKRIDAVGRRADAWLIVEVRPNAGLGALGSLITYRSLWDRDPPDTLPTEAWLVSDRLEPDTIRTATNWGLRYLLV